MVQRILILSIVGVAASLAGCNSDAPTASAEVEKSFKGGPMPPEATKHMADGLKQAQERGKAAAEAARKKATGG